MIVLLASLWIGGLIIFFATAAKNWGAIAVAASFSLFQWLFSPAAENTFKIDFGPGGLSVGCGRDFLWGASVDELAGVEVFEESKRWGIVHSPRRLVFYKYGGDQFSIGTDFFAPEQVSELLYEVQRTITLRKGAS
ncbi:MAG: hypothetical protein CVV05_16085 [Gammaproteobacteria bacterium HGW-Gammaproteobacteria-1]|nr:MAG: hypothetical protein CVV05_16085 [Gammaproteobacteria bacterium HGW-Gammaproteobacteria-1]